MDVWFCGNVPSDKIEILRYNGCENLKKVILPKSLKNMEYALNCCFSLEEVDIPSSVEDFSNTFFGTRIKSFVFPQGTRNIYSSFAGSEFIKKVVIPKSIPYNT